MYNLETNIIVYSIIFFLLSYLLGSIPFGLIVTKLYGTKDIRKIGSGNIGATNVLRTGQKGLAVITLILDGFKGYLSVSIVYLLTKVFLVNEIELNSTAFNFYFISLSGLSAVLGHCFPIWLKFRGGKGVATGFGVFLALNPEIVFIVLIIWILVFLLLKISSLSSLISFITLPILFFVLKNNMSFLIVSILISTIVIFKHKENILRLIKKEEPKFKNNIDKF